MSRPSPGARLAAAATVLVAVTLPARQGIEPFASWYYQLAWYPLLAVGDALLERRDGTAPLLDRPRLAASLFLWSAPVWLLWEAANLRLGNWFYVSLPPERLLRWAGTVVAFATVLPALYLGHRSAASLELASDLGRPRFAVQPLHLRAATVLGLLFVILPMWRPDAFFPLVWGAVTLLLEPWNWRRDPRRSLLGDLARGSWTRIVRLAAGGLAVGLAWETLNAQAGARWIYTVPGMEGMKLFEMPVVGFLGFPVLALDGFVIYQSLVLAGVAAPAWDGPAASASEVRASPGEGEPAAGDGEPRGRRPVAEARPAVSRAPTSTRLLTAGLLAMTVCAAVLPAMDRVTVASFRSSPEDLRRLEVGAGAGAAELARLRGLGVRHAASLAAAGIDDPCALAAASVERVSAVLAASDPRPRTGNPARVRVWQRAARRVCDRPIRPGREAEGAAAPRDLPGTGPRDLPGTGPRDLSPAAPRDLSPAAPREVLGAAPRDLPRAGPPPSSLARRSSRPPLR